MERGLVADDMDWDLLNLSFELDWQRVILVSEVVERRELHRMYQKLKRLRFAKYARALATHPFQMDLAEFGRAKIVEAAYRIRSAFSGSDDPGLRRAS